MEYLAANLVPLLIALVLGLILGWLLIGMPASNRAKKAAARVSELEAQQRATEKKVSESEDRLKGMQSQLASESSQSSGMQAESQQKYAQMETDMQQKYEQLQAESQQKYDQMQAELQQQNAQMQSEMQLKDEELADANAKLAGPVRLFEEVAGVPPGAVSINHLTPVKAPAIINTIIGGIKPKLMKTVQDMVVIPGVGKALEERLYNAGIGTYWEVANLTDEDMLKILQLTPAQQTHFNGTEVRTAALKLAEGSNSVGAIWNASQVDDLEAIPGISGTFEQRLYDAGINTYADLAACTPEQLSEICRPPSTMLPNYIAWIAKAKEWASRGDVAGA